MMIRTELKIKYFTVAAGIKCLASFASCTRLIDGANVMYTICITISCVNITNAQN